MKEKILHALYSISYLMYKGMSLERATELYIDECSRELIDNNIDNDKVFECAFEAKAILYEGLKSHPLFQDVPTNDSGVQNPQLN